MKRPKQVYREKLIIERCPALSWDSGFKEYRCMEDGLRCDYPRYKDRTKCDYYRVFVMPRRGVR